MIYIFIKFEKIDKKGFRFDSRQNTQLENVCHNYKFLETSLLEHFYVVKISLGYSSSGFDRVEETPIFAKTSRKVTTDFYGLVRGQGCIRI